MAIPDVAVAVAAFAGLAVGIGLDVVFLKSWASRFYRFRIAVVVAVFLLWSMIAVALCMGLPFGVIVLGSLAGVYDGRRQHHEGMGESEFRHRTRNGAFFTGMVTGFAALSVGLLGLYHEPQIREMIAAVAGVEPASITGPGGFGFIAILCLVLATLQYACTSGAAVFSFRARF